MTHMKTLLAGLALAGLAAGAAHAQQGDTAPTGITVQEENGVLVYRGEVAPPAPAAPPQVIVNNPTTVATAGRTLWLVDTDTHRITACQLRNTADHGRQRLRCTDGRLR